MKRPEKMYNNEKENHRTNLFRKAVPPIAIFCAMFMLAFTLPSNVQASSYNLTVVNCNEWISLRTSPSSSASVITRIPLWSKVSYISDASNGYYKVSYNGYVGYALSHYLGEAAHASIYGKTVVNCNSWISLRSAPNTSASVVTKIPRGALVSTYVNYNPKDHGGFDKVIYNGYEGYALDYYLQ